jgi:large subunit ribosomal protein L10
VRVYSFREEATVQRTDKEQIVAELAEQLRSTDTLIVADYRGLTNKQLEALRDELLKHGARFRIVKNTLSRRAAAESGAEALLVMLDGPTAIAFIESSGDPAAVAKALATTARETSVLVLRGGILEGKTLTGEEIDTLAKLPPADVLRGQLLAAVVAPLTQLVALVLAPLRDLHGVIEARIRQLEEQGEVAELGEATQPETEPGLATTDETPLDAADARVDPASDEPARQDDSVDASTAASPTEGIENEEEED